MRRRIFLLLTVLLLGGLCGCSPKAEQEGLGNGWQPEQSMRLEYATEFAVDLYAGGYKLLTLGDGSRFLVVPEGNASLPKGIARDIKPLYQPVKNIYLAATASMCLFDALNKLQMPSVFRAPGQKPGISPMPVLPVEKGISCLRANTASRITR